MSEITTVQLEGVELSKVDGNQYIAFVNERAFSVGPLLYKIISWLKENRSISEITTAVRDQEGVEVSEDEIVEIINDNFIHLGLVTSSSHQLKKRRSEYIYGKISLIKEKNVKKISQIFEFLFTTRAMIAICAASAIMTFLFYYNFSNWIEGQQFGAASNIALIYFSLIAIFFFHEVGHTSAAQKFGVTAKEIGFGFYFIFPVFFTDVTKIYGLDKWKRIIVNLGGVYFQLIVNFFLISIWWLLPWTEIDAKITLTLLVSTNTFVLLYSLNPFFRNDGYWIYSDAFNVKNMLIRSYTYPFKWVRNLFTGGIKQDPTEWPLLIFAVMNFLFIGSFAGVFITHFTTLSKDLYETLIDPDFFKNLDQNKGFLLKCFVFYGIIIFFASRYVKALIYVIKKRKMQKKLV